MKTFYVVTTKLDLANSPWNGKASDRDYAIFDNPWEMKTFVEKGAGLNALDDFCRLANWETINKIFCILAESYLDAIKRAWELCRR